MRSTVVVDVVAAASASSVVIIIITIVISGLESTCPLTAINTTGKCKYLFSASEATIKSCTMVSIGNPYIHREQVNPVTP